MFFCAGYVDSVVLALGKNEFRLNANFKEIFTGICGCLLLNFAEINGYNIILPNIIDTSKTYAGHMHRSTRENPWGSLMVKKMNRDHYLFNSWIARMRKSEL